MLKAKKSYMLPVIGLKKVFKSVGRNLKKNVPLLKCESLFDITIPYSDIPFKCSHVVENENSKMFDFDYFCKS